MKKRNTIGFELSEKSFKNRVSIKPDFDISKLFPKKNHIDYLKEFLLSKRNFEQANKAIAKAKTQSLPKDIKVDCKYCNGTSKDELDKKCDRYYLQMDMSFVLASSEFVTIVLRNKHIYDNKKQLLQLTVNFFNCLIFINGKGLMYFDLDKMSRYVLSAGFLSSTELFSKSEALNNLTIINNSIDILEQEEIQNEVLQREDYNFLNLQIKFFEKKQKFYSAKVFIEEKSKNQPQKSKTKKIKDIFLKDIFRTLENYKKIITDLTEKKLISKTENKGYIWNSDNTEPNLKPLKLLGTLAYILKSRNYLNSNISKKDIANAFTNTFIDIKLSEVYYGRIEKQLLSNYSGSKEEDYISIYYFIKHL